MPNHFSKNKTQALPIMKTNWKDQRNNTNENRDNFIEQMLEAAEYKRKIDHENQELTIWFMEDDGKGCKVSMYYTFGSCTITIENFRFDTKGTSTSHKFSSNGFSALVHKHFLTQEDLEQQRMFEQEKQVREDELKTKHKIGNCGGTFKCKICYSDASRHQTLCGYGT
jgi:hypothetical protein